MSRTDEPQTPAHGRRPEQRRWLVPLLWVLLPSVAAVVLWAWERQHPPQPPPRQPLSALTLTGDARRDRRAILERAADLLLPRGTTAATFTVVFRGSPLLSDIGLELLPLDPARGAECVRHSLEMNSAETVYNLDAPGQSYIGRLVRLAGSLRQYPRLAEEALQTAYEAAQREPYTEGHIEALCVFAQEAARIDPVRARSAVRQAEAAAATLPPTAPADPLAAAAAAVARVEGAAAARPLVDRALQQIPSGAARPLVEARLAAMLANAAPTQADALARQAVADVGRSRVPASEPSGAPEAAADLPKTPTSAPRRYFGVDLQTLRAEDRRKPRAPERPKPRRTEASLAAEQYRSLAITLALSHPGAALAALARIPAPGPSEARFRRAVRAAQALPPGPKRQSALIAAAGRLAGMGYADGPTSVGATITSLNAPVSGTATSALRPSLASPPGSSPPGGSRPASMPIEGAPLPGGPFPGPSSPDTTAVIDNNLVAEVASEPDLGRALAIAERAEEYGVLAPEALLTVARRLRLHGEAPRPAGSARRERRQRTAPPRESKNR